jgi:two-component system cell cycle sensor histidine kinase/response regulator CckA
VTETLRVLLVEDSATDAKLVLQELRRTGRVVQFERIETGNAMREALDRRPWDLVISDWSMPGFSAPAALAILKEKQLDLPFIIVSGTVGEESAVEAMRAGARDYVLKDRLSRLGPAVERELLEHENRRALREAELGRRESDERYRRLGQSGVVGLIVTDALGRIVEANDTFLDMLGYSRDEVESGQVSWRAITPPEWSDVSALAGEQLRLHGVARPWEKEYIRKDGSRVSVLVGVAKLDANKNISLSIDLTERKRAEAGLSQAQDALRKTEEQLRQAQKMEALGRLAGGVAHDFNNVLSVILGYGELILGDLKLDDPLRGDIEEIQKAASRAAGLTRELLLFSRQQVLEPKVIDLHDVLKGIDSLLQRILGEDVELVLLSPKSIGRVMADPTNVEQLILNLVVNARDAMPLGGKVTIELTDIELDQSYAEGHVPSKAGPYVMMTVSDTGTGMDRETQSRIFEPFFTTKEKGKGTGLGLSIVFGIVQRSGGSIWVYSEVGHGTTFKIYLPRVDASADVPVPSVAPTKLGGTETILLVEDEEQVRAIVLNALRRHGYHVMAAQHPGEAIVLCEAHSGKIDLLLTDVVMPHMSGPQLAKRLTALRPEMRVLCMSGYTDDSVVRHGALEPGVAFIQKPVTPALLARKVREVLDADPQSERAEPVPEGHGRG